MPPSKITPCTGVCRLDAHQQCEGCGRTVDEIATWRDWPSAQKEAWMASRATKTSLVKGYAVPQALPLLILNAPSLSQGYECTAAADRLKRESSAQ